MVKIVLIEDSLKEIKQNQKKDNRKRFLKKVVNSEKTEWHK